MIYAALKVALIRSSYDEFILLATLDDLIRFDFIHLDVLDANRQWLCAEKYAITRTDWDQLRRLAERQ